MARPTKQGIDYFPLDCSFDDKIDMFVIEHGAPGLGTLITIWQMIYSNEGYYIKCNNDLLLLLKRKINADSNEVNAYINSAIEREIFDKCMHKHHEILTSKAIQKRYFDAAKRKKTVRVCADFLLVDVNVYINPVNVDIYSVNVGGNATNVDVNVKEKVKVNVKSNQYTTAPFPKEMAVVK